MGASDFKKILLYIRSILWDLGIPQHAALVLYEDNNACTAMVMAQKPTSRTHHLDIKYQVLCEWVERDLLTLKCIDTTVNLADLFTKSLGPTLFYHHTDNVLGHVPPYYIQISHASPNPRQQPSLLSVSSTIETSLKTIAMVWSYIAHNPFNTETTPYLFPV